MYYISQNLRYPLTFPHVLYASQLLQAEAMRAGVEHWRRYRGRCMGAIYWQLNDCWPVSSWASVDYFCRWKHLQYAAKKFFAPVLVSCERNNFDVRVSVVKDTLSAFRGTAAMRLIDARGQTLAVKETQVEVPALSSAWVMDEHCTPPGEDLRPQDNLAVILTLRDDQGQTVSENCELFSPPKFFRFAPPGIGISIAQQKEDCEISLTSDVFTWGVWLETKGIDSVFNDNGFFLLPGESRTVLARRCRKNELAGSLTVTSTADLGR
jgi:beta-mannosidase